MLNLKAVILHRLSRKRKVIKEKKQKKIKKEKAMPCHANKLSCQCMRGKAWHGINFYLMSYSFFSIWKLLNPQGEYKRRRRGCERLWDGFDEATRQHVYDTIRSSQQQGLWINPNPYFAIEDTALARQRKPRMQTLSYADYYARYHTTEPRDGWQMVNPTGNKVIYIKN